MDDIQNAEAIRKNKLHNTLAPALLKQLVYSTGNKSKPDISEALIVLESVAVGIFDLAFCYGAPESVVEETIDAFHRGIKQRAAEIRASRLNNMAGKGNA